MKNGLYERHLRKLRTALKNQVANMAFAVARHFLAGTKISSPQGGLTLWVQMPEGTDSLEIFRTAMKRKIAILPGIICGSGGAYRNYIRVSCGYPWTEALERGIQSLSDIVRNRC
jgi:DNA-binding transcriptional MocR family regulator